MIGLIAEVETEEAVADDIEIDEVRWFTRDEAGALIARRTHRRQGPAGHGHRPPADQGLGGGGVGLSRPATHTMGRLPIPEGRRNGSRLFGAVKKAKLARREGRETARSLNDTAGALMNDAIAAIALGRRIDLTRQPDFMVGGAHIRPTACEVVAGGRRTRLQPRIMQVLVALARAGGEPLSREALMEVCWGKVTVGEDALNRCIQRLRRVAETEAGGAFAIETIPRIGYRLLALGEVMESLSCAPEPPLLAVLPFDNLSGEADMAWFSDGVSEEIQQTLARRAALKVIGRTSSFQFRGADKVVARVAAELKATHVLDGSVRRSGSRVRIAAQLVECAGQTTLWSDSFDRDLSDIFALQDEIAAAIAAALETAFALMPPVGKIDTAAYELYLQVRALSAEPGMPLGQVIQMLEHAVSLEPNLLAAWSMLAHRRALACRYVGLDGIDVTVDHADAAAAAYRALQLDPGCGLAHATLSMLLPYGDYRGREVALERALAAGARDPQTAVEMAWLMGSVGRCEEVVFYASQALELDPLHFAAVNIYAHMLALVGRYDESREAYARGRKRWPAAPFFVGPPLLYAAMVGDWEEFDRLRQEAQARNLSTQLIALALADGELLRDPTPRGRQRILQLIDQQIRDTGTIFYSSLVVAHRMGLADEVFAFIERASFAHLLDENGPPPAFNYPPAIIFDRIANSGMMEDIRFVGFCAKLGLCDYWLSTGHWPDCAGEGVLPYDFKAECRRLAAV